MNRQLKTFNFLCTFICAHSNKEKQVKKEYKAFNYLDAKKGTREYFSTNTTVKTLLELERL